MKSPPKDLTPLIREHPFAWDFDDRIVGELEAVAVEVAFRPGEFLLREGRETTASYLIRKGVVVLEIHDPGRGAVPIQSVGSGDVLGWSWILAPYHCHFDARAIEPVEALALDGATLRAKCEADHELGYQVTRRLLFVVQQRLERVRMQLLDLYARTGPA